MTELERLEEMADRDAYERTQDDIAQLRTQYEEILARIEHSEITGGDWHGPIIELAAFTGTHRHNLVAG